MSKKELRRLIRSKLRTVSASSISRQSELVAQRLRLLDQYQQAKSVAMYMHMPCELETTVLIENAFKDHKRVFLPRICSLAEQDMHSFDSQTTHLQMVEISSARAAFALQPEGKYGIREPSAYSGTNCLVDGGLDLIVVPAMGFTTQRDRIGHGAGYYDSFIDEHTTKLNKTPVLVGVALQEQIVPEIPVEPHDKKMDAVVVASEVY